MIAEIKWKEMKTNLGAGNGPWMDCSSDRDGIGYDNVLEVIKDKPSTSKRMYCEQWTGYLVKVSML
uniref:Uncharacterized protein n=1 Tax=Pristionchus pacificus TaxID=54126 RepID=A0A2A6BHH3_PRIPA|eukprot:PDM65365.1 hypothetical protein PRIPAC_52307 [Pristionchus pacificus]